MVEIIRVEYHDGYEISWGATIFEGKHLLESEKIVGVRSGAIKITLGQVVKSSGRYGPAQGALGLVTKLSIPHTDGRTMDIIDCIFEADMSEPRLFIMKLKDLEV